MKLTTSTLAALLLLSQLSFADPAASEWKALFDGKTLEGFQKADGNVPGNWQAIDGTLHRKGKGGDIWTKDRFGDFVLELEFKTKGNSGVFFRTDNPKDCVQTGIECQVENPGGPNVHSVGAVYDLKAPSKNVGKKDEWNKYVITCQGALITVELNGEKVTELNLDLWTTVGKNPDGTKNKFKRALKDWKRDGHIGFQDHGHEVFYRNIRIKPLAAAK